MFLPGRTFSVGASTIWSTGWSGYGAFLPLEDYDGDTNPDIMAVVGRHVLPPQHLHRRCRVCGGASVLQ
ncbi:hypothetical protein [Dactylosporangium cerinum]